MSNTRVIIVLVLTLLSALIVHAQDAVKDFVLINKAYENARSYKMNVNYTLYKSWTSAEILQTQSGEVKWKSNKQMYTRIGESETYRFADYMMQVDNQSKRVLLMAVVDNDNYIEDKTPSIGRIDTLLKVCKKVEYTKESKENAAYLLTFDKKFDYGKVKVVFNPKTYLITQLIFFYNTAVQIPEGAETIDYITRLHIDYSQISLKSKIPDNELNYAKYLVNNKGKLELRKEYTTYSFADQYTHFKKQAALKK